LLISAWQEPKQLPKRLEQQRQEPKQLEQPKRQPKQQQRQQEPKRLEQQQEPKLLEPALERRLVLVRQELLLFCCKQPEQQPTGRRSAGIFSWVFLN
jgi:hypothetical protein